jgi:hypothetical protein
MQRKIFRTIALRSFALVVALGVACQSQAQGAKAPYPSMAPLDQYLIVDRNVEITLARSAAPESISRDAEIMVLGRHGYETAVKGKNGFVCIVWRSWATGIDDPDFWNPKLRSPVCLNPPAARFNVPLTLKRTELILAGRSKSQMFAGTGLPGSPVVVAFTDTPERLTVFLIPVAKWSDGTAAPIDED